MEMHKIDKGYVSLVQRTVETQMMAELMEDYEFPNAICRSLKDMFMGYFDTYIGQDKGEGQIIYRAIPEGVPPGIEVAKIKTLPVRLTVVDTSDIEIASMGMRELIKHRIVRITNEAFDQGGVLTQADLSIILGEGLRTINRKIAELKDEGIIVPTRGNRKDIGPGVSHKAKIVEMYLKGYDFTEIKRRTRHSSEAISRYLNDFARISVLSDKGHTLNEMRIITGHSEHLIKQYLELKETLTTEESRSRIDQLEAGLGVRKKNLIDQDQIQNGGEIK
jgi:hypothetical protein